MDVFTAISLCSGYEGLGLGLKRAIPNLRTVCYVEREIFAAANLVAKIKEGKLDDAPIWDDLATFDPKPYKDMVHLIHGGWPCQGFSVAGKRLGLKDPRWLWPHFERIIKTIRPVWFFGENVSGHLSIGFPEVYRSLRNLGYSVEAILVTAAEVGAPHKRERLFILANSERHIQAGRQSTSREAPRGESYLQSGGPSRTSGELADHNRTGRKEQRRAESIQQEHTAPECSRWPSHPGQLQYEWEEPRVVANTVSKRSRGKGGNTEYEGWETSKAGGKSLSQDSGREDGITIPNNQSASGNGAGKGQTKPRLGRAVNGPAGGLDSNKGVNNEKVLNLQKDTDREESLEQEILQQPVLRQVNNDENANKGGKQKEGAESNQVDQAPKVQQECKDSATPQGLQQTSGSGNTLPEMPHQRRNEVGKVGASENRVDRLMLLGNGVVPQCAELAFRTLLKEF